ncbi:coiled-coil domain-containing protein 181 [Betta splendens]|uniref:Coiled-coil domain-containing protein 181 n=1 Tax=Betta splendens TaxID=158456 RepID=A0A6P7MFH2_BETSP|nr:coiled-coil domain-containing protein 181 [Betta splendens]
MSEVVFTKSQEEYEDDFEKDLDWLISEESRSEEQEPDYDDIEAEIDKELEEDEKQHRIKMTQDSYKEDKKRNKREELEEDEERWPSPMEPLECDPDSDSPHKSSLVLPPPPGMDDQTDEEKKYILEKIQQANRELQDQGAPDMMRRKRLHFKEKLVDLVVPPLQFEKDGDGGQRNKDQASDAEVETEVSGKLSELKLSSVEENKSAAESGEEGHEVKDGRVLVEKDGKFDLVSLQEVESQGLLPPIGTNYSDCLPSAHEQTLSTSKGHSSSSSPRAGSSSLQQDANHLQIPRPPAHPRSRPSSAGHSQRGSQRRGSKRRVQSATGTLCQTTYALSPQQKELLQRIQERRDKVAREAEEKKREKEEQKRQENELAFKAWLLRKREQLQENRRVHRAQELERMSSKKDTAHSDPEEAFRLWLHRKQEQQQKDKQLVELKRLEEDTSYLLRSREECERAFKLWLKRKRAEKRAEQQAVRERSRRLVLEERRARRMRDLLCTVNEGRPFRLSEQLAYRF